ncbi:MAG: hypothetical protein ACKO2V_10280 [Snowella sp.]
MSQRDNFLGGFLLGTLVGGTVGGVLGVVLATRRSKAIEDKTDSFLDNGKPKNILDTETNIELARRRLEDKIAQLNGAIDDVRHQLANVDNLSLETIEESQN